MNLELRRARICFVLSFPLTNCKNLTRLRGGINPSFAASLTLFQKLSTTSNASSSFNDHASWVKSLQTAFENDKRLTYQLKGTEFLAPFAEFQINYINHPGV